MGPLLDQGQQPCRKGEGSHSIYRSPGMITAIRMFGIPIEMET